MVIFCYAMIFVISVDEDLIGSQRTLGVDGPRDIAQRACFTALVGKLWAATGCGRRSPSPAVDERNEGTRLVAITSARQMYNLAIL